MQIVRLTAPFRLDRAVLNTGEVVGLPDDLADSLVSGGQALFVEPEVVTAALDGPPADKLMRPQTRKFFHRGSRHRDATQGE
jgi:hypothetical protein